MKRVFQYGAVSLTLLGVGTVVACAGDPAEGPEAVRSTAQAITCNPACTSAWTDCINLVGKGTPTTGCASCGGQGTAACTASGPDVGCQPQSGVKQGGEVPGQTGVNMGQLNGVCENCGDLNQPVCDATWQPAQPPWDPWFGGCNMSSEIYFPQPLQPVSGICAPCGWENQPACNTGNGPQCYMGGYQPSSGQCLPCGTIATPVCAAPAEACDEGLTNVGGLCQNAYVAGYPFGEEFYAAYVPDQKGQTMVSPRIVTIVASNDAPKAGGDGTDTPANLQAFGDVFPKSAVWAAVTNEYALGTLTMAPAGHVNGGPMTGPQSQANIQTYVQGLVSGGMAPAPNGNTIYVLYVPTAASLSFTTACGYHLAYQATGNDAIALVSRCSVTGVERQIDAATNPASHEVVEAASNPRGGGYNDGHNYDTMTELPIYAGTVEPPGIWACFNGGEVEIGDICEETRRMETLSSPLTSNTSWDFQRMFSNQASMHGGDPCIPAAADPYFSVSIPQQWYTVQPGGSVQIPVTGWSIDPGDSWFVGRTIEFASYNGQAVSNITFGSLTTPLGEGSGPGGPGQTCGQRWIMNSGTTGTLTINASASSQHGDFLVLQVTSFREVADCNPLITADQDHFVPVGVYVP